MVPSILGFAGALAEQGGEVRIVTPTPSRREVVRTPAGVELLGPESELDRWVRRASVLHIHGLWQKHGRVGARLARRHRVPYVVAAHGMADPWALRNKAWRKRIYSVIVEDRNLQQASCLHALAAPEVESLRAIAPRTPIALIPNGVDLGPFAHLPPLGELRDLYPELRDKFLLLFFGRIHAKKGLDLLAHALERVAATHRHAHLVLAGKDDGALQPFLARLRGAHLDERVTVLGHVAGLAAQRVWAAADAFVLPSYSEGFSMAVLEALAAGLPTLVTTACNFPELALHQAAITVEPTPESVTNGLRMMLQLDPDGRRAMAERGRALVVSRYGWQSQGRKLASVYRWLTGGGPPPECVVTAR
jgi:glycosyltransferase involved in cell wall biosynthesis